MAGVELRQAQVPSGFVRDLATATTPAAVFDTLGRWVDHLITVDRWNIAVTLLADPEQLEIRVAGAGASVAAGSRIPIADSLPGQCHREQQTLNIADLEEHPGAAAAHLGTLGLRSALSCPLVHGTTSFGTINVARQKPGAFTAFDEELMGAVGALVASFLRAQYAAADASAAALTDVVTGKANRRSILAELGRRSTSGVPTSVLYIDVDDFKVINDSFGHLVGDEVLRRIERRISTSVGEHRSVGRIGGDEFLVVLDDRVSGELARECAGRILEALEEPIRVGDVVCRPLVSIGIATDSGGDGLVDRLLADADVAMYEAKRSDQRLAVADNAMRERVGMITVIDRDLDRAIEEGLLEMHHQPICDLTTGEIMGAESLLRWAHPEVGRIPPPLILRRIEATGRLRAFTDWCHRAVCTDLLALREALPWFGDKALSMNLNARQLSMEGFAGRFLDILDWYGLRRVDVIIEVVEADDVAATGHATAALQQLADAGCIVALDDFGRGYNRLRYFEMFPIHALKFDRSLVMNAADSEVSQTILRNLSRLCDDLGVVALAEGLEQPESATLGAELGISHGQGWHFGHPLAVSDFVAAVDPLRPRLRR